MLTREDLRTLIERHDGPSVSIYMPTHRAGPEIQQDPIRLKNLLRSAEDRLVNQGLRSTNAQAMLEPARKLLDDELFWQHQSDGLAVFASEDVFRHYRLPRRFDELVVVTERFHVKPLIALLSNDGRFYVLAVSQNQVRLLQGSRQSVSEIDLEGAEGVPSSLDDALNYDNVEPRLQIHTGREGRRGEQAGIFHGHGGEGVDDTKQNLRLYFRQLDRGLLEILRGETAPLVLAGVDYELPIYREVNSYPHLLEEGITGNPEGVGAQELHDRAWSIVEPHFTKVQEEAAGLVRERLGTGLATDDLQEVLPAVHHGRVDSLFVALHVQRWGRFDPDTGAITLREEGVASDQDLLDLAAVQTMLHGGRVFAVEPHEVPSSDSDRAVAALFRY